MDNNLAIASNNNHSCKDRTNTKQLMLKSSDKMLTPNTSSERTILYSVFKSGNHIKMYSVNKKQRTYLFEKPKQWHGSEMDWKKLTNFSYKFFGKSHNTSILWSCVVILCFEKKKKILKIGWITIK